MTVMGWLHHTSTCSNLSKPLSNSASTSGCTKPLRLGQPKHASGGAISASTRRLRVDESQDLVGHRVGQDAIDQTDRLKGAQRLVVKPHPARIIDQRLAFIDHQGAYTLQAEDIGQGQTDRARADHDNVDVYILDSLSRAIVSAPAGNRDAGG